MVTSYSDRIRQREIDQIITFYQARIYLKDSELKILSDIAKDAKKMITFLEDRKEQLIMEMKLKNIDLRTSKIKGFVLNKTRYSEIGFG
ncbi:MAG: hypothetical protein KAH62_01300 [Desulfobacula sp.]|nr:hypothetical protein [Desulfobacula sp.]